MQDLPIKINTSVPGLEDVHSFTARIYNDALELAPSVVAVTQQLNIRSASTLLSYLKTFPQPVANVLGWTLDELNDAHQELLNLLKDKIPNQENRDTVKVSFGANKKE